MTAKLAFAICCLLVAVQARPRTSDESSTCMPSSTTCTRSLWTGYQAGKTYNYQFEQEVKVTSDLSRGQSSRMLLTGMASIEVHSDCEMMLKVNVQQTKATDSEDTESLITRETPTQVLEALRQPLRFSYQDGKVTHLCPSGRETRVSLNIKRGLLSQLQVSVGRGATKIVKERDIIGECQTEYEAEGRNTLVKTKDFAACKMDFKIFPPTNMQALNKDESKVTNKVTQGSLKCRIELHASKDLVKETICEEKHVQPIEGRAKPLNERVLVKTKLTLQDETDGVASTLTEVQETTGLGHAHTTSKECRGDAFWQGDSAFQIGAECGERKTPAAGKESSHHKEAAKQVLQAICTTLKTDKFVKDTAQKYSHLIKYLRGITTFADINDLYNWAISTCECGSQPFFSLIVKSAIAATGTKEMAQLAINEFKNNPNTDLPWLSDAIWKTKNPTSDMLEPIMRYFTSKSWNEETVKKQAGLWYGLSDLTYRICLEDENCESDPKVKSVIDFFSAKFTKACNEPTPMGSSQTVTADRVAIASIGNLGRVEGGTAAVIRCALKKEVPVASRLAALNALHRFTRWSFEEVTLLTQVLGNRRLAPEMRIAAFQVLVKLDLTQGSQTTRKIASIFEDAEDNKQVQFYMFTHLKNAKTQKRLAQLLVQNRRLVARMDALSRTRFSNNMAASFTSQKLGRGVQLDADLMFSNASVLPRSVNFNLSLTDPMLGRSQNLLDFSLHMSSMEKTFLEAYEKLNQQYKKWKSRSRRSVDWSLSNEQKRMQPPKEKPRLELSLRHNGATTSQTDIDMRNLKQLMTVWSGSLDKAGALTEETLSIPTIAGLPILIKKESHFLVKTNSLLPETTRTGTFKVNWLVKPNIAVQTTRTFAVDAVFQRAGIQTKSNLLSSTGVKLIVQGNLTDKNDLGLTFKLESLQKQKVADIKTEVNFFQHTAQRTTKKPLVIDVSEMTETIYSSGPIKVLGHRLNVNGRFLGSRGAAGSLMLAPSRCSVEIEKLPDFGKYEASVKLVNKDNEKKFEILLGDRNSVEENGLPKYLWKLLMHAKKDSELTLKFDLLNKLLPVQLHFNAKPSGDRKYQIGAFYRLFKATARAEGEAEISTGGQLSSNLAIDVQGSRYVDVQLNGEFNSPKPFSLLLPLATAQMTLKYPDSSEHKMKYKFLVGNKQINWEISAIRRHSGSVEKLIQHRIRMGTTQGAKFMANLVYDMEIGSRLGVEFVHNCHARFSQEEKADAKQKLQLRFSHMLKVNRKFMPGSLNIAFKMNTQPKAAKIIQGNGEAQLTTFMNEETKNYKIRNIVVKFGKFQETAMEVAGFTVTFKCPQLNDYELSMKALPLNKWTLTKNFFLLNAVRKVPGSPQQKYQLKLQHKMNLYTRHMVSQKVKLHFSEYFQADFQHELREQSDTFTHVIAIDSTATGPVKMESKAAYIRSNDMIKTEMQIESSRQIIFKLLQEYQLQDSEGLKAMMKTGIQIKQNKFGHEMEAEMDQISKIALVNFLKYQRKLINEDYNMVDSLGKLLNLLKNLKYSETHRLIKDQTQLIVKNTVNFREDNGVVLKWKVEKKVASQSPVDICLLRLKKLTSDIDGGKKYGIEIHMKAADKTVDTKVVAEYPADWNSMTLQVTSKDNFAWHNVQVNTGVTAIDWQQLHLKVNMIATGNVANVPLDHSVQMQYQIGSQKFKFEIVTEGKLQMVSDNKIKAKFSVQRKAETPLKLIAELKDADDVVCALKVNLKQQEIETEFTSAFTILKKVGFATEWNVGQNGQKTLTSVFKFKGLGKDVELKADTDLQTKFNQDGFFAIIDMTSILEQKGLDQIMHKKTQHSLKLKLKSDKVSTEYVLKKQDTDVQIVKFVGKLDFSQLHIITDFYNKKALLQVDFGSLPNEFSIQAGANFYQADDGMILVKMSWTLPTSWQLEVSKSGEKKLAVKIGTTGWNLETSEFNIFGKTVRVQKTGDRQLDIFVDGATYRMKLLTVADKQLEMMYGQTGSLNSLKVKLQLTPTFKLKVDHQVNAAGLQAYGYQIPSFKIKAAAQSISTSSTKQLLKVSIDINGKKHSITVHGRGQWQLVPVEMKIATTGYMQAELEYQLDNSDGSKKFQWKMQKVGSVRRRYNVQLNVWELTHDSVINNFKFSLQSPERHFLISKKTQVTGATSTVSFSFFLNKNLKHGFSTKYVKKVKATEVLKTWELELPTRTISLINKIVEQTQKFVIVNKFSWDAKKDASKVIVITTKMPKVIFLNNDMKIEIECQAPFFKKTEKFELSKKTTVEQLKHDIQLKRLTEGGECEINFQIHDQTEAFVLKLWANYGSQKVSDMTLKIRELTDGGKKAQLSIEMLGYSKRSLHLVYRPMTELTVACDTGYYISLTNSNNQVKQKIVLTIAGVDKNAERLSLTLNKQKMQVMMRYANGKGEFVTATQHATYVKDKDMCLTQAGLSQAQKLIFIDWSCEPSPDLLTRDPSTLTNFLRAGLKLETPTRLKYYFKGKTIATSSLLIAPIESTVMLGVHIMNIVRVNMYPLLKLPAVISNAANEGFKATFKKNINTEFAIQEMQLLSANDIDGLKAFVQQTIRNNDFFLNTIWSQVKSGAEMAAEMAGRMATQLKQAMKNFMPRLQRFLQMVFRDICAAFNTAIVTISDICKEVFYFCKISIKSLFYTIWEVVDELGIKEYLQVMNQQMKKVVNSAKQVLIRQVTVVLTKMTEYPTAMEALNSVSDFIQTLPGKWTTLWNSCVAMKNFMYGSGFQKSEPLVLQLIKAVVSKETIDFVQKTGGHLVQGQFKEALQQIVNNRVYEWQVTNKKVAINGTLNMPVKALFKTAYVTSMISDLATMDPVLRLLTVQHKTAIIQGDQHIVTFDGVTISHKRPCSLLLAHDYDSSKFSVIQTYKKKADSVVRDQLHIRMGSLQTSISRRNILKVNGQTKSLPVKINVAGSSVEARMETGSLVAKFHGDVKDALIVRCSRFTDSCVVKVHPYYIGKVIGAAGSLDGRKVNDIHGDAQQHMRLWTTGQCLEDGDVDIFNSQDDNSEERMVNDQCRTWFSLEQSALGKCFKAVQPHPFVAMCSQYVNNGKDACKVVNLYAQMCRQQNVNVDIPYDCRADRF